MVQAFTPLVIIQTARASSRAMNGTDVTLSAAVAAVGSAGII